MQRVVALQRAAAGARCSVFARLLIKCAIFRAEATRVATCRLKVSFLSNQTPSQRRAVWTPLLPLETGVIVRSPTEQLGA